ncbi:MAG: formylmethanofuran dehydrogenase subunit C [Planctomycetaceae bacterium]|nr:formylmethanofuran dehydrogenase subunit C [Planctomycetaceae bacterium]
MALELTYFGDTRVPVEIEGLTPDWACDKSLAEIARFELFHGNRRLPLAEMFRITGSANDRRIDLFGDLSGVHWLGAGMASGEMHVHGSVGRHAGSHMRGGTLQVQGNAAGWLGTALTGGLIHVRGDAGDLVGAADLGAARGMTGGTILIDGNAGHEIGRAMRRGVIAIGGTAGDLVGFNMLAGTVLVFGGCGQRAGAGMRRGTIGILGRTAPQLLPTFRHATALRPQFMAVILRHLRNQGLTIDESLFATEFEIYHGDRLALGRGELLVRRGAI